MFSVMRVRFLLTHFAGSNARRVPYPQLVPQLPQQPLEPQRGKRRLQPHLSPPRPLPVETAHFLARVFQPAHLDLPRLSIDPCCNLVARMQITSDNVHGSAPFPAILGRDKPSLPALRSRCRYLMRGMILPRRRVEIVNSGYHARREAWLASGVRIAVHAREVAAENFQTQPVSGKEQIQNVSEIKVDLIHCARVQRLPSRSEVALINRKGEK